MPSVNVLGVMGNQVLSPVELIKNISHLDQNNKSLQDENNLLTAELAKAQEASRSCTLLSEEVAQDKGFALSQTAKVIGRTPGGLNSTLLLDKGSDDGVQNGSAVLTNGYFIGKIQKVEKTKSEVMLIFSHGSLVPVSMEKNSEGGLLQGGLEGLTVTDIPISSKAETGDGVITSGLGGDLPPGLLIGKIGAHLGLQGDLFQKVTVVSPINPYDINYVTVLVK